MDLEKNSGIVLSSSKRGTPKWRFVLRQFASRRQQALYTSAVSYKTFYVNKRADKAALWCGKWMHSEFLIFMSRRCRRIFPNIVEPCLKSFFTDLGIETPDPQIGSKRLYFTTNWRRWWSCLCVCGCGFDYDNWKIIYLMTMTVF